MMPIPIKNYTNIIWQHSESILKFVATFTCSSECSKEAFAVCSERSSYKQVCYFLPKPPFTMTVPKKRCLTDEEIQDIINQSTDIRNNQ